ncbi:MAG: hypothetical protein KBB11_03030 [Bacteroidales bacterium]|nr:hypothetical protein [Bacteroidales bacterium]HOY37832.1 hypothetical protein [Bacteroidales bacterium]
MNAELKDRLKFRRQFIFVNKELSQFSHWEIIKTGKYFLYVHPDLNYSVIEKAGKKAVLLGYIIDYRYPELSNEEIIGKYLDNATGKDSFIKNTNHAGGRWVLYYSDINDEIMFNDATGMRQIFHFIGGDVTLASTEMLLSVATGEQKSAFIQKEFVQKIINPDATWFPNTSTNFENIKCLISNTLYDIKNKKVSRFWPIERMELNYKDLIQNLHEILSKTPNAIQKRYPLLALGTTSGSDSRISVGYFMHNCSKEFIMYTIQNRKLTDESPDIRIPAALGRHLGIPHWVIRQTEEVDKDFEEAYRNNNANFKPTYYEMAYNLLAGYPQEYLSVQSVMNEIARQRYAYVPYNADLHDVRNFTDYGHLEFAGEEFKKWIVEPRQVYKDLKLQVEDLFFMEQRMGRWNSANRSDWDLVQEVFEPWNSRIIWLIAMSIHRRHKQHTKNHVYRDLFDLSWKAFNEVEINRGHQINYTRYRTKKLLSKIKRELLG